MHASSECIGPRIFSLGGRRLLTPLLLHTLRQNLQRPYQEILPELWQSDAHPNFHHIRYTYAREPQGLYTASQGELSVPSAGDAVQLAES